jgi:tRNA/rRNA methyltransferase
MHIPTREEHFSMNLGQAVAICLYELIRDSSAALEPEKGAPATSAEVERIYETLLTALQASGYPKLNSSETFQSAVRRMVHRLRLYSGDAEFFLGMLRQVVWKLKIEAEKEPESVMKEKSKGGRGKPKAKS